MCASLLPAAARCSIVLPLLPLPSLFLLHLPDPLRIAPRPCGVVRCGGLGARTIDSRILWYGGRCWAPQARGMLVPPAVSGTKSKLSLFPHEAASGLFVRLSYIICQENAI
ncbi:hypothetical protein EDB86DRAFT_2980183 [Lactarius hatsudake]|nr:hypothetical protein EDB86DRAFT_2980183 [Lactarius hatsudake]